MDRSYEFDPTPAGPLARAARTPISDLLCGRVTARYNVRAEIARGELPVAISGLIYAVVRKSRLSRSEKLDLARELVAHFQDGLAAGRTAEQLMDDFGSVDAAAQLIYQAKFRQRSLVRQLAWYSLRGVLLAFGLFIVGYIALAIRFFSAVPNIEHNYWTTVNELRRVPDDERAWPLYREAGLMVSRDDDLLTGSSDYAYSLDQAEWPALVAMLQRNQRALELARQAAEKPHFGYYWGDPEDKAAAERSNNPWLLDAKMPLASENKSLVEVDLRGMNVMRMLARLLVRDAQWAAREGDAQRFAADVRTLLAMAEHIFQPRATLVEQLVSVALFNMALDLIGGTLVEHPELLSDSQLRNLAHLLSAYRQGDIRIDLDQERDFFDDQLQRIYSDNGRGDGSLTPAGIAELASLRNLAVSDVPAIVSPAYAAVAASRSEERKAYRHYFDSLIAVRQGSPWEWDYHAIYAADERLSGEFETPTGKVRHPLVAVLAPAVGATLNVGHRATGLRDGTQTAIALVLWKRRHGDWPERLEQLVPELLPAVPLDRFDGQPLRFAVRDGQPVLYSVGQDRHDGGGHPADSPISAFASFEPVAPRESDPREHEEFGDWILWPPLAEE